MVRALLDGSKTQTRRVIKATEVADAQSLGTKAICCPYAEGQKLWVRETCRAEELPGGQDGVRYEADGAFVPIKNSRTAAEQWIDLNAYRGLVGAQVPPIHMPRWACRLELEITNVCIERLQDIGGANAIAEGVHSGSWEYDNGEGTETARESYQCLWDNLNAARGYGWDANPWVWVVQFRTDAT
ncbi:hypothetical protein PQQ96_25430 [Paraburkholderia sediminicola]|uniref:hypothetical protein n=1 Tax=Paraburkholderia sediminicola TaxID=458836 RepID=UPI0038BD1CD2